MRATRPNRMPHSQNTKHDRMMCGVNVSLPSSAFTWRLSAVGVLLVTVGSTTCPLFAFCTTYMTPGWYAGELGDGEPSANCACRQQNISVCRAFVSTKYNDHQRYTPFTRSSWLDGLLYVSWTSQLDVCLTFARCLLDVCFINASCRLCFMHASYMLDVCSMFAQSCKRGITQLNHIQLALALLSQLSTAVCIRKRTTALSLYAI